MDSTSRPDSAPEVVERADALRGELEVLRSIGAAGHDGPGFALIQRLLEAAESLARPAREIVVGRTEARLATLRASTQAARSEAEAALAALVNRGVDAEGPLGEAFAQGDWRRVRRAARRLPHDRSHEPATRRMQREAYRGAAADFSAALALAAVRDSPPVQPGLLNGSLLAVRVLEEAERLSPRYRQHLVAELIDLAALMTLPPRAAPRKRR